jgi:hypothetical protein
MTLQTSVRTVLTTLELKQNKKNLLDWCVEKSVAPKETKSDLGKY